MFLKKTKCEKFDASSEIRKCVNRDLVRFEPGSLNGTEWHPYYTTTRPPMPIYWRDNKFYSISDLAIGSIFWYRRENLSKYATPAQEVILHLFCRMREASGLVRSKKLFGGLLNDIKRKKPFYISDFLHGFHPQCLSSFLFLYFACLAPIVAFGALLGEATENRIATIESLVSGTYLLTLLTDNSDAVSGWAIWEFS